MLTAEQRKGDIAKIIKTYLIFHGESSSREIFEWFGEHDFAINQRLSVPIITRIIKTKSNETQCHWFNVERVEKPGEPLRWRIKE